MYKYVCGQGKKEDTRHIPLPWCSGAIESCRWVIIITQTAAVVIPGECSKISDSKRRKETNNNIAHERENIKEQMKIRFGHWKQSTNMKCLKRHQLGTSKRYPWAYGQILFNQPPWTNSTRRLQLKNVVKHIYTFESL